MDNKNSKITLDQLWLERKAELNNIVRKKIFIYSFINTFMVLSFLGLNYKLLVFKFPTTAFVVFVGGNFLIGTIARRFVSSKGEKGEISRRKQYLVLMAWQNTSMFIIMLWAIGFAIAGWLTTDAIPLPIYWLVTIIIFSIFVFIWWIPRKKIFMSNTETANRSEYKKPSNLRYLGIIGLLIFASRTISRMVIPDVKSFIQIILSLTMGTWLIYFVMYIFYRDYLLWKNGYLD